MQKLYFYPTVKKSGLTNPYLANYKTAIGKYYNVIDKVGLKTGASISLLFRSFNADIYILNWVESVTSLRLGIIQYWIVRLSLWIIKSRKKKIIWMLHNIHPHKGTDKYSESIMSYLFEHANLIISHSEEAADYAKERAKCRVKYICHPVTPISESETWNGKAKSCDVLIWGNIYPYKGIVEFISENRIRESSLQVLIVGKCSNEMLQEKIESLCINNIHYENRSASFGELKAMMAKTKYVIFPYVGSSISSSGALIDTIMLGGTPIGPNVGAFKDLHEEGVCFVYSNMEELMAILSGDDTIDKVVREDFISRNTWDGFAFHLNTLIKENL